MSKIILGILGGGQLGSMLSVAAKKMNIETNESETNFLLVNFNKVSINSHKVFQKLANAGILVRKMDVYGIKNSLRITIGKSSENKKLIFLLRKIFNV